MCWEYQVSFRDNILQKRCKWKKQKSPLQQKTSGGTQQITFKLRCSQPFVMFLTRKDNRFNPLAQETLVSLKNEWCKNKLFAKPECFKNTYALSHVSPRLETLIWNDVSDYRVKQTPVPGSFSFLFTINISRIWSSFDYWCVGNVRQRERGLAFTKQAPLFLYCIWIGQSYTTFMSTFNQIDLH